MAEYRKKLIEVALPLEEINAACKADKDRKTGTIRNLHKWFAPMPLPAWRAMLYAALVDDPQDDERRAYHLDLIKRLVSNGADLPDTDTLNEARANLRIAFPAGLPPVMDPFCGGGSTLVEAQRLGLESFGSDLNPVPVLISRTLTQLLPGEAEVPSQLKSADWLAAPPQTLPGMATNGASRSVGHNATFAGLEADVLIVAEHVGQRVWTRVSEFYPSEVGERIVAWHWVRTAICANPVCGVETLLTSSWWLSKRKGDMAWMEPVLSAAGIDVVVRSGRRKDECPQPTKISRGAAFSCLACSATLVDDDLERQAESHQIGYRLVAVTLERAGVRTFRAATPRDRAAAAAVKLDHTIPDTIPATDGSARRRFEAQTQAELYIPRQLLILGAFADEVAAVHGELRAKGASAARANAIVALLALAVGKLAQYGSTQSMITTPATGPTRFNSGFGRNDLPMTWDFYEQNFFGPVGGNWDQVVRTALQSLRFISAGSGEVHRQDARIATLNRPGLIATDPPYFDAIGYADLSDYFYVWHRRALRAVFPDLYSTMAVPKVGELTAIPSHHGHDKEVARRYFIDGFTSTFLSLQRSLHPDLPLIVVYASKEQKPGGDEETRWSSILTAMLAAGLEITGTWPIHGTGPTRMLGMQANVVATYVAMVCRPRPASAEACALNLFNRVLRQELRPAVHKLQAAGVLPVDLAQAAMGPGMLVFSRYSAVLDQSGAPVSVDAALRLINQALSEVLEEQEGELDPASRFAVTWWQQHHWSEAAFGEADQLARPQGLSVDELVRTHVVEYSRPGQVRVLGSDVLERTWYPEPEAHTTAWEVVHHLADRLIDGGGVSQAASLMARLSGVRDQAQGLVYRLHSVAAANGWAKDQERYNALIGSWSDLLAEAGRVHSGELF